MSAANKKRRILDQARQFTTLFSDKTHFVGTIHSRDNCIVYGQVDGDCHCDGVLVLGEQGRWQGNIVAPKVIIHGAVKGDITVTEQLELGASARVNGNISSSLLSMAVGAVHIGGIQLGSTNEITRFREQRAAERTRSDGGTDAEEDR
jgi:cytoskeletal protein CcmA (bactofilin family)